MVTIEKVGKIAMIERSGPGPCGLEPCGYNCSQRHDVHMRQARGEATLFDECLTCSAFSEAVKVVPRFISAAQFIRFVQLLADNDPAKLEELLAVVPENRLNILFDDMKALGKNARVRLYLLLPSREQGLLLGQMTSSERKQLRK